MKQFKKFDAQIIQAINKVVPPPAPGMFMDLKVPDGCAGIDSEATVVRAGDGYRVVGHASFAVILGYGYGGAGRALYRDDETAKRYREVLGDDLARKLESAALSLSMVPGAHRLITHS